MAKKAKRKASGKQKKAPSPAQIAARKAFAERARGKSGGKAGKSSKKTKRKGGHAGRMSEPNTAASVRFKDDATSTYERAAVVPVLVPKPESLPDSTTPTITERKPGMFSYGQALNPKPFAGKPKAQDHTATAFFF